MLRRLLALCAILILPVLASVPALARTPAAEHVSRTPLAKHSGTTTKHGKTAKRASNKTGKTSKTKKISKSKAKTKTKTKTKGKAASSPAVKARNTPIPTATPTQTPTPAPTNTPTPLPTPAVGELQISLDMSRGYTAAFTVCGLPAGASAVFSSNPVSPAFDSNVPQGGVAQTTLNVVVPYTVATNSYLLAIRPYFQDASGHAVAEPPNGFAIQPRSVLLTVDGAGNATLSATSDVAAVGNTGCSALPPGYSAPVEAPSTNVAVSSAVSNPHPSPGEAETLSGTLKVDGQPVSGVLMRSNWYLPHGVVDSCDAPTGSTGTATCSLNNDNPVPGFIVQIQVTFEYEGQQYTTYSSYTM